MTRTLTCIALTFAMWLVLLAACLARWEPLVAFVVATYGLFAVIASVLCIAAVAGDEHEVGRITSRAKRPAPEANR